MIPTQRLPMANLARALVLILLPGFAHGEECFVPSPSATKGEAITEEIAIRDLTRSEYQQVETLFNGLKGRWRGSAQELECQGTLEDVKRKEVDFSAEAVMELDSKGELSIDLKRESSKEGIDHQDHMSLHLVDKRLRVDDENPAGDVEILKVGSGTVSFLKKNIHRAQRGGVVTQENVTVIELAGQKLRVKLTTYTNGVLTAVNSFELNRK